ncbi:MAG TPA: trigger factor family protein, partial [Candidatus Sulfotelmatobacter sp.]|nr:trigger factor family protein [Candidatus Sulfotelmatobacter sp.]
MENAESKALESQQTGATGGGTGDNPAGTGQPDEHGHAQEQDLEADDQSQVIGPEHAHGHGERGGPPPMDPACKRELEIEIPAEVVSKQRDAIVQQYSKQARVPGFRKGK